MDERERREINSSTMGFEEVFNINRKKYRRGNKFSCAILIRSVMRLPVWPNLLPNISFLMRSVGSIETIMTRTPGTLWDPIRLQGVSGLIGKRLPADHNQIGAASINLSPTPFASITIISHILWISVSSLPTPGHRP